MLLLLVPQLYASGHLVEGLAVIELELGPPSKKILELCDEGDLRLHPDIETSQLFVQLQPYVCNRRKETRGMRDSAGTLLLCFFDNRSVMSGLCWGSPQPRFVLPTHLLADGLTQKVWIQSFFLSFFLFPPALSRAPATRHSIFT